MEKVKKAAQDNDNRFQPLWVSPNLRHSSAQGILLGFRGGLVRSTFIRYSILEIMMSNPL